jgi:hypothetical protein
VGRGGAGQAKGRRIGPDDLGEEVAGGGEARGMLLFAI